MEAGNETGAEPASDAATPFQTEARSGTDSGTCATRVTTP